MKTALNFVIGAAVLCLFIAPVAVVVCALSPREPDTLRPALRKVQADWLRDAAQCRRNGEPLVADVLEDAADRLRFTVEQHPQP